MSAPFALFEELVGEISDVKSLIEQGIEEDHVGPAQLAELGDLIKELQGILEHSHELYKEYLDGIDAGESQSALGAELMRLLQANRDKVAEIRARAASLLDSEGQ